MNRLTKSVKFVETVSEYVLVILNCIHSLLIVMGRRVLNTQLGLVFLLPEIRSV